MPLDLTAIRATPSLCYETIGGDENKTPAAHLVGTADEVRGTARAFMRRAVILLESEREALCDEIAAARTDIPALIARVRELEEEVSVAASVQRAQVQANAMSIREADELRAEIANERGEGDGPSEGWRYDAGTWLYGVDEDGLTAKWYAEVEYGPNGWIIHVRGMRQEPITYDSARAAMRAADAVRGAPQIDATALITEGVIEAHANSSVGQELRALRKVLDQMADGNAEHSLLVDEDRERVDAIFEFWRKRTDQRRPAEVDFALLTLEQIRAALDTIAKGGWQFDITDPGDLDRVRRALRKGRIEVPLPAFKDTPTGRCAEYLTRAVVGEPSGVAAMLTKALRLLLDLE